MANKPLKSIKFPGLTDTYTITQIDTSLTVEGKAADAQAVGNKFTEVSATAVKAFPTDTLTGDIVTFADGADDIPMKSVVVNVEPVQSGSGDPSPDNVRPISGWTGAQVVRTGRNLWNLGDISATRKYQDNLSLFSGTYTFSAVATSEATDTNARIVLWGTNMQLLGSISIPNDGVRHSGTITVSNSVVAVELWAGASASVSDDKAFTFSDVQAELGSTATEYEPYTGDTYSITFPTEAGTVYGGTLDVTNGVLTVDRAMVDLGTLTWSAYTLASNCFKAVLSDGKATRTNYSADGVCSSYAKADYITTFRDTDKTFGIGYTHLSATVCYVAVHDSSYSDAAAFKTAMDGVQLVYELATPITYHLTPTEIKSLLGDNNIWADAGDTTVTYRADTKLYIDKKIADIINALS